MLGTREASRDGKVRVQIADQLIQVPKGRTQSVLETALTTYLEKTHQPNHARVLNHRVDGRGPHHVRFDVYAETDRSGDPESGRTHRYYEVTLLS